MKFKKQYILCFILIAIGTLVIANVAFANNSTDLKEYNFDSHFTMKIPQNVSLEKTEGQKTGDITLSIVYKNDNAKINIGETIKSVWKNRKKRFHNKCK